MLRDRTQEPKGKITLPHCPQSPVCLALKKQMQSFPKPTKDEKRAEETARQQGFTLYEQVQALLRAGDLIGGCSRHYWQRASGKKSVWSDLPSLEG